MILSNKNEKVKAIKSLRSQICFPVINRGRLWYDRLTPEQLAELEEWYQRWLDAPKTLEIPKTPDWVNNKTEKGETIL